LQIQESMDCELLLLYADSMEEASTEEFLSDSEHAQEAQIFFYESIDLNVFF
jgi:hypothetical protein